MFFLLWFDIFSSHISKWIAVEGTAGYYAIALRDIQEGQELTFNYGLDYFDGPLGCPCSAHREARSHYLVA